MYLIIISTISYKPKSQPCHFNTIFTFISTAWQNERNENDTKTLNVPTECYFNLFRVKAQLMTEMCLAISFLPFYMSQKPDLSQTPVHPIPLETGSVIWQGLGFNLVRPEQSGVSRRGTTCDKWVLSGGCGVGKLTLFPSDYISRQENGMWGEWLEFHRTRGRHSFSLVCRLIKRPGGGIEEVCWVHTRSEHDLPWLWCCYLTTLCIMRRGNSI